ncbi:MAG: cupin domain-containing protein [Chitinophagaceae bacterium]
MEPIHFANLIAPLTVEDFFANYWEKKYVHNRHDDPGYFNNVLSIADIDTFLSQQNLMPEGLRLLHKGKDVPPYEWTKSETLMNGTARVSASPEKMLKWFYDGSTIIINSAEKGIPGLAAACRAFEQEMKIVVQANIYITPPHSQGFHIHYDPHDIFLMQIKGPKTWHIYDTGEELPTTFHPFRKKPELVAEFDINSGDFLYLARGTSHQAFTSDHSTIHVNFSLKPRYGFHLIEDLVKIAEHEDVFFRRTIPTGLASEEEKKQYTDAFKQKLHSLVDKISPKRLLDKQSEHFATRQTLDFGRLLITGLQTELLRADTVVARKQGFDYVIKTAGNDTNIHFGTQRLTIPPFVDKAIFLQDQPFKIKDVKGLLTAEGKVAIVKELIAGGWLEIREI